MRLRRIPALLVAIAIALSASGLSADGAAAPSKESSAWVIGLCRLALTDQTAPRSILLDTIPRLIVGDLASLPKRHPPEADVLEMDAAKTLRARFAAGSELASKLDARAASFFAYTDDEVAWRNGIDTANAAAVVSSKALDALVHAKVDAKAPAVVPSPHDLVVKLWADHAAGKLIDAPAGSLAQAAKAAGVDLLVSGSLAVYSDYASLSLRGFDSGLGRDVFAWKGFCAVDDPEPLAAEMAGKLEAWSAGRPFARVELKCQPASTEIRVGGVLLAGSTHIVYAYEDGPLAISATASGFSPLSTSIDLQLGDRKVQELTLEKLASGSATLNVEPPEANLSLDSAPLGKAPQSVDLEGTRSFLTATAPDYESKTVVLPASGQTDISIKLLPADGLGPKGRIEAAKDHFYSAFGFLATSIPVIALSAGVYSQYSDAYALSGNSNLYSSAMISADVLTGCIVFSCVAAAYTIFRLVQYLGTAN